MRFRSREREHGVISTKLVDALGEFAGELFVGGGEGEFGAGMNEIGDGFGLGEIDAAIEKGAAGEFAGLRQSRPGGQQRHPAPVWPAGCRRDRRGISTVSSRVNVRGAREHGQQHLIHHVTIAHNLAELNGMPRGRGGGFWRAFAGRLKAFVGG